MSQLIDAATPGQFDRMPPHDIEAEQCVIASALVDKGVLSQMRGILTGDDFSQPDHQVLWDVVCSMADADGPIDYALLLAELRQRNILEEIGGAAYIGQLLNTVPNAANGVHYAKKVKDRSVLRGVLAIASDLVREAHSPYEGDAGVALALKASEKLVSLATHGAPKKSVTLEEAVHKVLDRADHPAPRRIETGIRDVDHFTGGLGLGLFTLVGGQPGMGKSQIVKQFFRNIAGRGIGCGLVTIEENAEKVAENFLAAASGIENSRIAFDRLNPDEWAQLFKAAPNATRLPIHIEDSSFTLPEIEAAVHRLVAQHGCQVVAIDHLHLIDVGGQLNREREISKISAGLKRLFRRLNVAGVGVAQLNRSSQAERPTLRSLRDSGSLEQDGDVILLLHREDYHRYREPGYIPTRVLEVIVAKNKNGRFGTAKLEFDGATQTVRDFAKQQVEDPTAERDVFA